MCTRRWAVSRGMLLTEVSQGSLGNHAKFRGTEECGLVAIPCLANRLTISAK